MRLAGVVNRNPQSLRSVNLVAGAVNRTGKRRVESALKGDTILVFAPRESGGSFGLVSALRFTGKFGSGMTIVDKRGVLERVHGGEKVALELGCGNQRRDPSAIGIDMLDFPCVDLVGDVFEVLSKFPANSVERVSTSHFMEHVVDVPRLLSELSRVLMPGGIVKAVVPHFSNPFYYSDPTHRSPFGLYTMAYFCEQDLFSRGVPSYAIGVPMVLEKVQLGFKSIRPRYVSHAIKRAVGALVNCSMYTMEFYEENLCWLFPCYEIHFEMRKKLARQTDVEIDS